MKAKTYVAWGMMAVGAVDLLLGNTNSPLLPDVLANKLTQQIDLALIGGGLVLLLYV